MVKILPKEEDVDEMDTEFWTEEITEYENQSEAYSEIEPMDTRQQFQVMKDFIAILQNGDFQEKLYQILQNPKPFRNFKLEVEHSEYRKKWFEYRDERYTEWVIYQLKNRATASKNFLKIKSLIINTLNFSKSQKTEIFKTLTY